ncbi:MAG: S41 family peptidase, partial [Gemmatimonadales bacterium]
EIFTLAMRALPHVTQVGRATRGALSDEINKPLPNGWLMQISAEEYRDSSGILYEARGIPPDWHLNVFPSDDLFGNPTAALDLLITEIKGVG